jgi:DNA-binding LacI/PurR family transcriptional regulator
MATIRDVAELANVSIATVSRVLNGTGYVSPELAQRVRQAAAKLGYQSNTLVRHIQRNDSLTLGVLLPGSGNPFYTEVARGVQELCSERGFRVIICYVGEDSEKASAYVNALRQQRVAGFVVISPDNVSEHWQRLLDDGYPLVMVDRIVTHVRADAVVSDNYSGAAQAVNHLIGLGHRNIGFVTGRLHLDPVENRWRGVTETLAKAGIPLNPDFVYDRGDYQMATGFAAAEKLFSLPNPPTAVFAFNDLMAYGLIYFAHTHGITVPDQLSVIGFDDIELSTYFVPGLTTISQPKYELGRTVAEILLGRIAGNREPQIYQILPTQLVVRGSTAPLP